MSGVRIVTDSACDLPSDDTDALGIRVVPLTIRFGNKEFVDRDELSVEEFYERMAESSELPETAAPAPGAFQAAFQAAADDGADAVVCINLSSGLSATMQSAQNAASAMDGFDVRVIDSKSLTAGQGAQVLEAARAAQDGKTADEIVALVDDLVARTEIYGALDTLDNLKKGGRIGNAQALLGSMLSIKPVLHIGDGVVEEAGKLRTRRRALEWLRDKLFSDGEVEHLTVAHGEAPDLDDFCKLIAPRYPAGSYRVGKIGAVIGTHGGPRVLGVCYVRPR